MAQNNGPIPYGYIYRITNKKNGKSYIGSRKLSRDRYWREYLGSGKLIKAALRRYGEESFTKELLLYVHGTQKDLHREEWRIIQEHAHLHGGAQYNLYHGPGAGGDTFSTLSPTSREAALERQRRGVKESQALALHREAMREEKAKAFSSLMGIRGEEILAFYREDGSMLRTCQRYAIPLWRFSRYLDEVGERKHHGGASTDEEKARLSKQSRERAQYKSGESWEELHGRLINTPIEEMRGSHSREEMLDLLRVSSGVYKGFLRRHGMGRKPLPCDTCRGVDVA